MLTSVGVLPLNVSLALDTVSHGGCEFRTVGSTTEAAASNDAEVVSVRPGASFVDG
jgi:hypothetical protein